ncbi:hypothetical protein GCM10011578_019510 [Streptomyces fuscichromogenes]|uniref:Uncharacterized protein n=1 Tax=Streptomyces fuscichromogenes TaxID=1324013 RepID=A0A917X9W7_9ACTN|nr:hypothetical protein GCM10011578_019510 [Streptomyces fuscichromogenes]
MAGHFPLDSVEVGNELPARGFQEEPTAGYGFGELSDAVGLGLEVAPRYPVEGGALAPWLWGRPLCCPAAGRPWHPHSPGRRSRAPQNRLARTSRPPCGSPLWSPPTGNDHTKPAKPTRAILNASAATGHFTRAWHPGDLPRSFSAGGSAGTAGAAAA